MSTILGKQRAFRNLEVDKIELSEMDLREEVDEEKIAELASTVSEFAILQPILVSVQKNSAKYKLILGGRRLRAARKLEQETIPAFIVDDISERNALIMMLIENMQREDLEPLEEARGMAELRDRFKFSDDRISQTIGKRIEFVQSRFALLRLPKPIQLLVAEGKLGVSQATSIARLEGKEATQIQLATRAVERGLSAEIVERMVQEAEKEKRKYRKIDRKHRVKKSGKPLSKETITAKLQQVVLRGEDLLETLDGIPMKRWDPESAEELQKAILAIEQGLQRYARSAERRAKEKPQTDS